MPPPVAVPPSGGEALVVTVMVLDGVPFTSA
jgi:hypothetical protein